MSDFTKRLGIREDEPIYTEDDMRVARSLHDGVLRELEAAQREISFLRRCVWVAADKAGELRVSRHYLLNSTTSDKLEQWTDQSTDETVFKARRAP